MTTSSSEATTPSRPDVRDPTGADVVRHRVTAAASTRAAGVRGAKPVDVAVRVVDRVPPPPPPPKVDVTPLARAVESGMASVRALVESGFAALEKECVELALAAAQRLVRRRADAGELDLEAPLREMLQLRRRELATLPATLRLHPADAELLAPKMAELAATVQVAGDPSLQRGTLVLEVGAARLVRALGPELERLRRELLGSAAP